MFNSKKNIFINETEIKPNKDALLVLVFLLLGNIFCWFINEIGLFRVGKWEMRIGSSVPVTMILVFLIFISTHKDYYKKTCTKWIIFTIGSIFTLVINTLLNFHTTIMLLFPIFIAMLYKSKKLGIASMISSISCTVISPILGYVLHVWDIPLLQELILIATNTDAVIVNPTDDITILSIAKIILYLILPRTIMVGSCSLLMFRVIKLGAEHVENQLALDDINHKDMLTGLYNRNYFSQITNNDFVGDVGLIMFDVNGLKKANDTNGHEYGDALLINCAKSILAVLDENTAGFRIGGDEFLLIMECRSKENVIQKYEDWKKALEKINQDIKNEFGDNFCSMASGLTFGDFNDIRILLHEADTYMYKNKALMKNEI